jgi:hypothetical protein
VETTLPTLPDGKTGMEMFDCGASRTRTYLSINLSDDKSGAPPLQLTMERGESNTSQEQSTSAISLSQTLTLDRYQLNPMENRAPRIRNALAWTIRMARNNNSNSSDKSATVTAAATWQINRGLALKTVVDPSSVTTAVILKRWRQPRLSCSVVNRYDWNHRKFEFVGFGLELESGCGRSSASNEDYYYYPDASRSSHVLSSDDDVPETRATVRGE